ncbi:tagaturonate reductase [Halanaerobium saccharolyticum]|jgi:tagaturonate reductase|uniref:Tagaturonate reductase n=1 Tax=Halanaerobium saccharolyticum TaxID=43595 RepID=A0A2T5RN39_9FIRM|nr:MULTISPECIES: tagaturonate reductase [Halanaerobium]PTW00935.1 tagaturonate reductase [Halanaerobium saccharolyticum]PUU93413.1 MAG: tagaturonate reductase [Halanaerobium sp.]
MAKNDLPMLDREYLESELLGTELADFSAEILDYPEKVVQIGEGNFLRAFVDWMFHTMNKKGHFKGRTVVVQPIREGRISNLNEQDGLYTLYLRGIENGEEVNKKEIMTAISRGIESYSEWDQYLKLAENPEIEFVVSNTTEAGIAYNEDDKLTDTPPESYPAKLAAYLYHRYQTFNGARDKGMVIIPVELIDRNGDNLKRIILKLADDWNLEAEFKNWIEEANHFLNTLVDRIVTGYPFNEIDELEAELGYHDQNLDTGEIFHLWVIEGDESLKEKLPFHKAGLNVKWVDDLTPYRTTKVRILNGAHTSTVPVSYLAGIDLVRDAVNDELVGEFINQAVFEDIIPTLDADEDELEDFASKIFERFKNPYIDHKWLDISLNSTSKFKTRVLPSLVQHIEEYDKVPERLSFALAALIHFYHGTELEEGKLAAYRDGEKYLIRDDKDALNYFADLWSSFEAGEIDLAELGQDVLANQDFWDRDLNELPGLTDSLISNLNLIKKEGMKASLEKLIK